MNRNPFTKEELDRVRVAVDQAVKLQDEHGTKLIDAHPWLVRAIATIDELQAKAPAQAEAIKEDDA